MITINQISQHINHTVTGQFLLTNIQEKVAKNGNIYKQLTLEDSTGQLTVYVWPNSGMLEKLPFSVPRNVRAEINVRVLNHQHCGNLVAIYSLAEHEIINAARLLPISNCPPAAMQALATLVRFVDYLPQSPLKSFVNQTLAEPEIAQSILTTKGSMRHHHKQNGGLLIHSVEVLRLAYKQARSCNLSAAETNITAVAALLHDIGKIRTVGPGYIRPVHYQLMSHEGQNLMLLTKHLERLSERSPEEAAALQYIFHYLATPRAHRGIANFIGADIVAQTDSLSAALANRRRLPDLLRKVLPMRSSISALEA